MTPIEIESWALRALVAIKAGSPFEDSRVELKSEFPSDPIKAARRIAAHANSAMGASILWLIGVDQKTGIVGTNPADLANWFEQIKSGFDGVYPPLCDLVVHFDSKVLLALQFDTNRAPYLVKNPQGGAIQREVPWREGTQTRTATREELLMLLQPDLPAPEFEILNAEIVANRQTASNRLLSGSMEVYIVPRGFDRVVFPFHRCFGKLICEGKVVSENMKVRCSNRDSSPFGMIRSLMNRHTSNAPVVTVRGDFKPVEVADEQIILNRPARIHITARGTLPEATIDAILNPTLEIVLGLAESRTRVCVLTAILKQKLADEGGKNSFVRWKL